MPTRDFGCVPARRQIGFIRFFISSAPLGITTLFSFYSAFYNPLLLAVLIKLGRLKIVVLL